MPVAGSLKGVVVYEAVAVFAAEDDSG